MTTQAYQSYDDTAQAYLAKFHALRTAPPAPSAVVTRGAGEVDAEVLIASADEIADVSTTMIPLAAEYLQSADSILREGISGQLLAQAAAELQVATELLQIAEGKTGDPTAPITRATRVFARRQRTWLREEPVEYVDARGRDVELT